ncbi:MAG: peptidyl-prolyl cis-trans isomerase [Thermacetogeniaceae bacterium]
MDQENELKESSPQGAPGHGWPYWPQLSVFIVMLMVAGLWYWWSESGDWVVRVNRAPISRAAWQQETSRTEASMASMLGFDVQAPGNEKIRAEISKEVLKQMVERALLSQAASRAGIAATPEDVAVRIMMDELNAGGQDKMARVLQSQGYTLDQYRHLVAEMLTISKLNEYVTKDVVVTEEEIRAAYKSDQDLLTTPEQVKVGQILVPTKEKAAALIAELDKGANFEKLADSNSTDPGVKDGHGVVGYITRDDPKLPEAFKAAAFSTPVGAYTKQPVQSEFGWHVLFVYDKKAPQLMSYADARGQLQQQLLASKKNEAFVGYLNRLLENGLIERRVQQQDVPKLF